MLKLRKLLRISLYFLIPIGANMFQRYLLLIFRVVLKLTFLVAILPNASTAYVPFIMRLNPCK